MTRHHLIAAAALAALAGCGPGPELEVSRSSQAESQELNGTSVPGAPILQGCNLPDSVAGTPLPQGCSNNGPELASPLSFVSLQSIAAPDGSAVDSASLQGTRFVGRVNGVLVGSEALVGAQLNGTAVDGSLVRLRLDRAEPGHSSRQWDVWRYDFTYRNAKGEWKHLCEKDHDKAVVVSGRWDSHQGVRGDGSKSNDPTVFTIACRRSAIEKCINAGYKPWSSIGGVSLDAHHQACVRMMRADYCGDGVSHTVEGREINLYDPMGLMVDDRTWFKEAEWTAAGARCVNPNNLSAMDAPCALALETPACGEASNFGADTLLVSETPKAVGRFAR